MGKEGVRRRALQRLEAGRQKTLLVVRGHDDADRFDHRSGATTKTSCGRHTLVAALANRGPGFELDGPLRASQECRPEYESIRVSVAREAGTTGLNEEGD